MTAHEFRVAPVARNQATPEGERTPADGDTVAEMSGAKEKHAARVYLAQARAFRLRGSTFAFTLLEWAGNARRRAMRDREQQGNRAKPSQGELFA